MQRKLIPCGHGLDEPDPVLLGYVSLSLIDIEHIAEGFRLRFTRVLVCTHDGNHASLNRLPSRAARPISELTKIIQEFPSKIRPLTLSELTWSSPTSGCPSIRCVSVCSWDCNEVRPYNNQLDITNENFPGSVQTQVIGINNRGGLGDRDDRIDKDRDERDFDRFFRRTTVGFWSNTNNANMVNNSFGFVNIGGQNGRFANVNNPNTGTINGIKTTQFLGGNGSNNPAGLHINIAI